MATLAQIFSANVQKLLLLNGWSYLDLAERCKGKLSQAYISKFRHPDKINPTLEVVETVAQAFCVSGQQLLNLNFTFNKYTALPPGYFRKEYLVDEFQDRQITEWEDFNKKIIDQRRRDGIPDFR